LSEDKLYHSAECLVAFERYMTTDKSMLFRWVSAWQAKQAS
jgi:hypothetical protein